MCISRSIVKKLPLIVIISALIPVITILTTYTMSVLMGHLPEGTIFPQISLTGNHVPEYYVYAAGFGLTGLLMVFLGFVLHVKIIRCFLDDKGPCLNITAMIFLYIAAIGLVTQGAVHLQPDFGEFKHTENSDSDSSLFTSSFTSLITSDLSSSSSSKSFAYTLETIIHLSGAAVFFVSALVYVILMDILLGLEDMRENGFHASWWVIKIVLTVLYIAGAGVSCSGTYFVRDGPEGSMFSAIGQWTAVFSFIIYIATFAGDIHNVNEERLVQNGEYIYRETGSTTFYDDTKPLIGVFK